MFKVGPAAKASGSVWDDKGKSEIAQIYIGGYENRFKFIQFLYVENGNTVATSKILGLPCEGGCTFFDMITLDYPSEYITGVSGWYQDHNGSKFLRLINFHTNKTTYGPFIASPANKGLDQIEFNYQVGSKFHGFFGTYLQNGVESIGIYSKPMDKLTEIVKKNI
ncbi:Inactive protein restricted tev movement 1 [Heracleum sosnowskyi]|uniref:Inactive protein restricted tev movement 1 n=1 Tax=Heracleum sosnowskyi TaxID=360622 RepID=A0AAD8HMQ1_9APIA|nr:Inactive protein restricted tev movement 1 [Heracleum sosnowskyi]